MKALLNQLLSFFLFLFAGKKRGIEIIEGQQPKPNLLQRIINHYRQAVRKSYYHNNRKRTRGRNYYQQTIWTANGKKTIHHKTR